ncbi:LysM domain-containing protein [Micromonospora matsumotoense]|uniref:LysM domain-containing protein n=1 Tax=Micromonospora matsumotoense TaxID=121616 RepID=A0A1C5ABZ9_9ACTN|nr:BTAD domain-containing putative transcriptional regulator [Micromonospora matsumotoense]SCF42745.1 LysM domain-containing protein [Micromonospora matsumotoense]
MGIRTTARIGKTLIAATVIGAPALLLWDLARPRVRQPTGDEVKAWISQPLTPELLAVLAIAAGWALWALLAITLLTHLSDRAGRRLHRLAGLRLPGPLQGLTAALLGATAVTAAASGATPAVLVAADSPANPSPPPLTGDHGTRPATPTVGPDGGGTERRPTVVVRRGDSLSAIAARRLDDADRWREIYSLNRGARFTTGSLTDPDLIRPGWRLRLPAHPDTPAPPAPSTSSQWAPNTDPNNIPSPPPDTDTRPPATPATTTPEAPATPRPDRDRSPADCDRPGVSLGDRGWIDAALAAAVLAAATLAWTNRRTPPGPTSSKTHGHDPQTRPLPTVLARIRRALPMPTPFTSGDSDSRPRPLRARGTPAEVTANPTPAYPEMVGFPRTGPIDALADTNPVTPEPTSRTTVGWPAAGLGLTGPAAQAAARGLLVSTLATAAPEDPEQHGQVVIPSSVLTTLLRDHADLVADTPRLTVTDTPTDALNLVEEQVLRRTRVCGGYEVDTVAALRDTHPTAEALPPLLLITDATAPHERARTAALLTQGQRLDIRGVLLGAWADGNTVAVVADGSTTAADGEQPHDTSLPGVGRLTVVTPADTVDLLAALARAHADLHPRSPRGHIAGIQEPRPRPAAGDTAADDGLPPDDADEPTPTESTHTTTIAHHPSITPSDIDDQPDDHGEGVAVQVLGGAYILRRDTSMPLRAKALELLVYLVVHDGEATQDTIIEDLLPDAPLTKAPHRLHTYVSALRKTLARTGGHGIYLTHPTHRYALNRQTVDADLWRMRAALCDADRATDDNDRLAALRRAVDAYGGSLADGFDYEWIEAHREGIRRQALDAHLALARTTPDPDEALTVIRAAIRHDPYAEPLYQQAMRTCATLGHLDEIHALRHALTRRLAEIDAVPSQATLALADHLSPGPSPDRLAGQPRTRGNGRQL